MSVSEEGHTVGKVQTQARQFRGQETRRSSGGAGDAKRGGAGDAKRGGAEEKNI